MNLNRANNAVKLYLGQQKPDIPTTSRSSLNGSNRKSVTWQECTRVGICPSGSFPAFSNSSTATGPAGPFKETAHRFLLSANPLDSPGTVLLRPEMLSIRSLLCLGVPFRCRHLDVLSDTGTRLLDSVSLKAKLVLKTPKCEKVDKFNYTFYCYATDWFHRY